MDPTLERILGFLSRCRIRATYGAVAGLVGVPPRSVGMLLGARTARASWVVSAKTGRPTDYNAVDIDPLLTAGTEIIRTSNELARRMRRGK
jgi:hypothetical protein